MEFSIENLTTGLSKYICALCVQHSMSEKMLNQGLKNQIRVIKYEFMYHIGSWTKLCLPSRLKMDQSLERLLSCIPQDLTGDGVMTTLFDTCDDVNMLALLGNTFSLEQNALIQRCDFP